MLFDPFEDVPLVGIDTETTGLKPQRGCRVIELAAVRREKGKIVAAKSWLLDPGGPLPDEIVRITGITDEMIAREKVPHAQALAEFDEIIGKDSILAAHNAPFDAGFIVNEYHRAGRDLPNNPLLDTLKMAKSLAPGLANYKLATVHASLLGRRDRSGAHRAGFDTRMCVEICDELVKRSAAGPRQPASKVAAWGGSAEKFADSSVEKAFGLQAPRLREAMRERKPVQVLVYGYPLPKEGDFDTGLVGVPVSVLAVDKNQYLTILNGQWGERTVKIAEIQELRFRSAPAT